MRFNTVFTYTKVGPLATTKTGRFSSAGDYTSQVPKKNLEPKLPQKAWPFPYAAKKAEVKAAEAQKALALDGIHIVHCIAENGKGGVTIAWCKTSDWANSNFVEVAVAYCSPHDTFNKRIGRTNALFKFHNKNTVLVPARFNKDDYTVPDALREMFWYSVAETNFV